VSGENKKRRFGTKRWIVLLMILFGAWAAYFGPTWTKPISPTVALPAEPAWNGAWVTNTILATILTDIVLILIAISVYRFVKSGKLVPSGLYNAVEAIFDYLYSSVEGATGKWVKRVIPLVATIFLLIFVANMIKLVPGFESIGWLDEAHKGYGYGTHKLFSIGGLSVITLDRGQIVDVTAQERQGESSTEETHGSEETAPAGEEAAHTEGESTALCEVCHLIPFLRGSATDLNFTFALAVIAVVMVQVYGVWALGPGYFTKFFQFKRLISGGVFGIIDFGVGFLELILEFAKILSFSFRLFGNIFAGALLLSIIGTLLPIIIPPGLYLFEVFFGVIQAYVFFLLATMFISMALVSHHGDDHQEAHT
jgi:F-type H+-transporting ATPase subunit a